MYEGSLEKPGAANRGEEGAEEGADKDVFVSYPAALYLDWKGRFDLG